MIECQNIIIRVRIGTPSDLIDYKFFCFNGEPKFCQVIKNRSTKETIDFYDTEWNLLPFIGLNPTATHSKEEMGIPPKFDKMLELVGKLSAGISFLRVDLYNINGRILFGENTFYPASGFGVFSPADYDLKLGNMLNLKQ